MKKSIGGIIYFNYRAKRRRRKNLIIVKAKTPKKGGKDIVYETKELYYKIKCKKGE